MYFPNLGSNVEENQEGTHSACPAKLFFDISLKKKNNVTSLALCRVTFPREMWLNACSPQIEYQGPAKGTVHRHSSLMTSEVIEAI